MTTLFLVIMGVSGCGKTSIGEALARTLGWPFYDADDYHPPINVSKMASGTPLTDSDRRPWLAALHDLISSSVNKDQPGVMACSALKVKYRQQLRFGLNGVHFVYLKGSYELIWSRMEKRAGHYMKPQMLQSQFDTLEEPKDAITIDITLSIDEAVQGILKELTGLDESYTSAS